MKGVTRKSQEEDKNGLLTLPKMFALLICVISSVTLFFPNSSLDQFLVVRESIQSSMYSSTMADATSVSGKGSPLSIVQSPGICNADVPAVSANIYLNGSLTVDSFCQCVAQWTRGKSQSTAASLWFSDYAQAKFRQAAFSSLQECWNWPGALDNLSMPAFTELTNRMLSLLNSYRLKKSIKTRASPFVLERLFQVILKRIQDPDNNPPLRVAVMGGSVTEGFRSRANSLDLSEATTYVTSCTWACKLEKLFNDFWGPLSLPSLQNNTDYKVVEVKNFAAGGTDSSIGVTLLEYNLFGTDMSEMDIFISAFGANDLQAPEGLERDRMYLHMQRFMRTAKAQRPCNDLPLVIQIDDVFADALRPTVRGGFRYFREMLETNSWVGFMSLSYSDAIRDVVYANTTDTSLQEFQQLHPGLTFHTGLAWVIAYNLLEGFLDACDASSLPGYHNSEPRGGFPLPILHDNLVATDVSEMWKKNSELMSELCAQNAAGTKCEYQYIAHRLGARTATMVREAISRVASHIDGWEAIGRPIAKPRRTWKAMRQNATFAIQLDNISIPINRMLILYVKSYGKEWESTRLKVSISGRTSAETAWNELKRIELMGYHDARTSINYSEQIDLGTFLETGSSVRATFTVVEGKQFQINGLALCHSLHPVETIK